MVSIIFFFSQSSKLHSNCVARAPSPAKIGGIGHDITSYRKTRSEGPKDTAQLTRTISTGTFRLNQTIIPSAARNLPSLGVTNMLLFLLSGKFQIFAIPLNPEADFPEQ